MTDFIFCHGFGFTPSFWEPLLPFFSQAHCSFVDLGYFQNPSLPFEGKNKRRIGIGHSLGVLKLSQMRLSFDALIGVNGFHSFLGVDPVLRAKRKRELDAFRAGMKQNPENTLRHFYKRCQVPTFVNQVSFSHIDQTRCLEDLDFLAHHHVLPSIPILMLSGSYDCVVPPEVVADNLRHHPMPHVCIQGAGHNLGFEKPLDVYQQMSDFLHGL